MRRLKDNGLKNKFKSSKYFYFIVNDENDENDEKDIFINFFF